jgi:hypothetical protein
MDFPSGIIIRKVGVARLVCVFVRTIDARKNGRFPSMTKPLVERNGYTTPRMGTSNYSSVAYGGGNGGRERVFAICKIRYPFHFFTETVAEKKHLYI